MSSEPKKVVWILGSGFSRSLGGPLLDDLLSERGQAEGRARVGDCFGNIHNIYWMYLKGHDRQTGPTYWRNAEEFLDFVQSATVEGSPRRKVLADHEPKELHRLAVLAVASECLFDAEASQEAEAWHPYVEWAGRLNPGDTIISFNYDCVVDRLLDWNPELRLRFPEPYLERSDPHEDAINVWKLHGSVNWFDEGAVPGPTSNVIERLRTGQPPILGTPGPSKAELKGTVLYPLWYFAVEALKAADVVVFMGYRFPPSDSLARSTLLQAIKDNEQKSLRIHTVLGPRTQDDDTVRLVKLLEHTMRGAGRILPGEGFASPPKPRFFQVVTQPLYVEDFLTVVHDGELYGEESVGLTVTGPEGSGLVDVVRQLSRIEVLDTDRKLMVADHVGDLSHPDRGEVQGRANDKASTVWQTIEVHNRAGRPARNVIVDFTVNEAMFSVDHSSAGSRVTCDNVVPIPGGGKVRQRIEQVAAGTYETLAMLRIRPYTTGRGDEVATAAVHYVVRREDGIETEGHFEIRLNVQGVTQLTLREAVDAERSDD